MKAELKLNSKYLFDKATLEINAIRRMEYFC